MTGVIIEEREREEVSGRAEAAEASRDGDVGMGCGNRANQDPLGMFDVTMYT